MELGLEGFGDFMSYTFLDTVQKNFTLSHLHIALLFAFLRVYSLVVFIVHISLLVALIPSLSLTYTHHIHTSSSITRTRFCTGAWVPSIIRLECITDRAPEPVAVAGPGPGYSVIFAPSVQSV